MPAEFARPWPAGWYEKHRDALASNAYELVLPELLERWRLEVDIVRRGVDSYVDAFIHALGTGTSEPLADYIVSLDSLWQAVDFDIVPILRGMFAVREAFLSVLPPDHAEAARLAIDIVTQRAVTTVAGRSASIVTTQLEDEIRRHRAGEERLRSVQRVSAAVVSDLDLSRTLDVIADEALQLVRADAVSIRLPGEDGRLGLIASSGAQRHMLHDVRLPIDESLCGEVFRTGSPVRVVDSNDDHRVRRAYFERTGATSVLIVPLRAWDRSVGVLAASAAHPCAFSDQDEETLAMFAGFAAVAIENAQLYSQAREQIAELSMLHRVSSVVSSSLDLDEVFQALFDEVRRLMPADSFLIGLSRENGRFDLEFIIDDGRRYPPRRDIQMSEVLRNGLEAREPLIIDDVRQNALHARMQHVGNLEREARSLLAVPLLRGGEMIGLISAQSYTPYNYRERDSRMLMTIANQAAVAIEHARLYQDAQSLAVVEERNRLAREIHDTITQGLIGIILFLEQVDTMLPAAQESARSLVLRALDLTRESLEEARRSVRDLRAAPLEGRTLLEAIENVVSALHDEVDFEVTMQLPASLPPLTARVETALFRVVQEAITNCQKHSRCTSLEIELSVAGDTLMLRIEDDGVGFDHRDDYELSGHFGLATMRERVSQIGGLFSIESQIGQGACVSATVPLSLAGYSEAGGEFQRRPIS